LLIRCQSPHSWQSRKGSMRKLGWFFVAWACLMGVMGPVAVYTTLMMDVKVHGPRPILSFLFTWSMSAPSSFTLQSAMRAQDGSRKGIPRAHQLDSMGLKDWQPNPARALEQTGTAIAGRSASDRTLGPRSPQLSVQRNGNSSPVDAGHRSVEEFHSRGEEQGAQKRRISRMHAIWRSSQ
jgi:hypothetical protein